MSNSFLSRIFSPTVLLYAFLVITEIGNGAYLASGEDPPPAFTIIRALGFLWIIGWWLRRDSRSRGIAWVYDMGMFLNIAWPFIMPYYLIKSRGPRGLLVILGFAGAFIGALVVGVILFELVTPGAH